MKKLLDELNRDHEASEQAEMSASRRKIQLQETQCQSRGN